MNEPERLYLYTEVVHPTGRRKVSICRTSDTDVEYTRTDTFIEKACEYFRRGLEDTKVTDDYRNILVRGIQASYTSVEEFIEDFKKYMEGE